MEGSEPEILVNAEGDRTTPSVEGFRKDGERVGRQGREEPGGHQSRKHRCRIRQALHRPFVHAETERRAEDRQLTRSRTAMVAVPSSTSTARTTRPKRSPPWSCRSSRPTPRRAAALGEPVAPGSCHRPRPLQRRSAPGHQGRRQDRGPRRLCVSSTSPRRRRSPTVSDRTNKDEKVLVFDLGVRHVRRVRPGAGRRRVRGRIHRRRQPPGRRRLATSASSTGSPTSSRPTTASTCARTRWPGERRAPRKPPKRRRWRRCPPRRRPTSTGPPSRPTPRARSISIHTLTRAEGASAVTKDLLDRVKKPVEQALKDAGLKAGDIDEVILVGGSTAHACRAGRREEAHRQGPEHVGEPRRSRGHGRRRAGRRAGGRRRRHPAARRDPAVAGRRDHGRRHDQDDRAQHHHPDAQDGNLLHRVRQPDERGSARAAGRAPDGLRQQDARASSS